MNAIRQSIDAPRYGVAIVGLGQIGMGYDLQLPAAQYVYSHARAFEQHPRFRLLAGIDADPLKRHVFTTTYRATVCDDVEGVDERPDVVVIATPTSTHLPLLERILASTTPRAVLCEKPLAYAPGDASAMVEMCASRGVGLYVNYMRRCEPGAMEVARRIDAGEISGYLRGTVWYSKGFMHNASHFFNLAERWLGDWKGGRATRFENEWDGDDCRVEARSEFVRGDLHFIPMPTLGPTHHGIELMASNGRLRYDQGGRVITWEPATPDPRFNGHSTLSGQAATIASDFDRFQRHVADQLAAALDGMPSQICTGEQALTTLNNMTTLVKQP